MLLKIGQPLAALLVFCITARFCYLTLPIKVFIFLCYSTTYDDSLILICLISFMEAIISVYDWNLVAVT